MTAADRDEKTEPQNNLLTGLLGLLLGGRRRPPFNKVMDVLVEGVFVNLEMNLIHDNRSVGVALLQIAGTFLCRADVDKEKAQQLLAQFLEGKLLIKDDATTKLAAELCNGRVEMCRCEDPHPTIILDDIEETALKVEAAAPGASSPPMEAVG
jgi:hypothetical protein